MKNQLQKFILLCLLTLSWHTANAYDCKVDGIYYNLSGNEASVTYYSSSYSENRDAYTDSVSIPSTITYNGVTYDVTSIGNKAFYWCDHLTAITIPSSVTTIKEKAFHLCTGLTAVHISNLASWCGITFGDDSSNPLYNAHHLFLNDEEIKDLIIPNGVTDIRGYAFYGYKGLTSVKFPDSLQSIWYSAFQYCTNLTSIILPDNLTTIGKSAFDMCSALSSVTANMTIPFTFGRNAFFGVANNCELHIPFGTKSAYVSCGWDTWIFKGGLYDGSERFSYTDNGQTLTYHVTDMENKYVEVNASDNSVNGALSIPSSLSHLGETFSVTSIGNAAFSGCSDLISITIPNSVTTIGYEAFSGCSGLTSITIPNSVTSIGEYAFSGCSNSIINLGNNVTELGARAFYNCKKLCTEIGGQSLLTCWNAGYNPYQTGTDNLLNKPYAERIAATQTTVTIKINAFYSEYVNEYCINNGQWHSLNVDTLVITGLPPEYNNKILLRVSKETTSYTSTATASTQKLISSIQNTHTASSITARGVYIEGDANVVSRKMILNGISEDGDMISQTGLDPNKEYSVEYAIVVSYEDESQYTCRKQVIVKTSDLTLTTSQPKVISAGNAIVAAESNLDDEETNVGFEWRREDWPDNIASNTGGAYLYEGTMEGYIRNLYTGAFWKYRPYYLSSSGTYYYGDWVGLDPTNTSYFEPTVHTYARINIEGNTALVRGYALRGTDNVTVQGFMYWKQVSGAKEREDGQHRAPAVPKDAVTVEASGQVMEAQLTGLDYETTYCYVAFVKTSEGETFYGETQTFTTDVDVTSIESIAVDSSTTEPATVVARYNMNGQRITTPQRGVNILRMSDGTVKKVLVK